MTFATTDSSWFAQNWGTLALFAGGLAVLALTDRLMVRKGRQWAERLIANHERARALVGERTYRIWVSYLAGSSMGFAKGWTGLYQVVGMRPDAAVVGGAPPTREAIYALDGSPALARRVS